MSTNNELVVDVQQIKDDMKQQQQQQPERKSRNPFKKNKKKAENKETEDIVDTREPNLKFKDSFTIYKIIGWNWILIFLGSIGAMGTGVIPISFQFVMGDLINVFSPTRADGSTVTAAEQKAEIGTYASYFAIIAAAACIANFMSQFFLNWASERIGVAIRSAYFDSLTVQEMGFFDIKKVGALTITLSEDITRIQEVYSVKLATLLQNLAQFVVGVILALTSGWQMALVMMSTTPLMILGVVLLGGVIRKLTLSINKANDHSASIATEVMGAMRTVRSMAGEEKERVRYKKDLTKMYLAGIGKAVAQGSTFGVLVGILWGTTALAFWYGGGLVVDGTMNIGSMLKVFGLTLFAIIGISQAGSFFPDYGKAMVSQKTVLKLLKRQPAIIFKGGKTLDTIIGNVTFENVDFVYPSRPNATVLKNFSLDIKAGQAVALVGPSGSGKSTIVGLLERFYDPAQGKVYLDGVDIAEIDPMWLHKNIGIVTQEPVLFATSIYKNIAYAIGEENTTMEKVIEAAKSANCHNFIMDLPDGYNTLLGERGVSLSGGQKQRVCIARALLQNPKLLLLDEATSALDTESESLVQAALDLLMKGRTTICIAHRLSTVKNSDKICVLAKGILKETGTHAELMAIENGIYKNLAERQMLFSNENADVEATMEVLQ
ncbi:abc transporter B family protein [Naegleria gruberi]|uniref:Abc transporter B family protein n=1 Tax=Naegleria gruberi TaxID=5762 RepID=D2W182_NAEGR|nr:abc transporter B family protein [Naegleria gruberi]EFC37137.1 abc transporter B family protein [Naegleria gruberi]|eukprot:XP_002669881.1 abc transporter B family protein [Naegleria gruberi strain NEG-M]